MSRTSRMVVSSDFANLDGRKIQRIMSGGMCEFPQFVNGVVSTGAQHLKAVSDVERIIRLIDSPKQVFNRLICKNNILPDPPAEIIIDVDALYNQTR